MNPQIASLAKQYWFVFPILYLVIGAVIGSIIRYVLDRHLWVKHRLLKRVDDITDKNYEKTKGCICDYHGMGWDFFEFMSYASFALWPFIFAIMAVAIPFCAYAKILGFVGRIARREPKPKFTGDGSPIGSGQTTPRDALQADYDRLLVNCQGLIAKLEEQNKLLFDYKAELEAERKKPKAPDLETTVEEEFRKRTGRDLGEFLG